MSARLPALALAVALAASSCANSTGYVITGKTLQLIGTAEEETYQRFVDGSDAGTVTQDQVDAANKVLPVFQGTFPPAVDIWTKARRANEPALQGKASELISVLVGMLEPIARIVGVSLEAAKVTGGLPTTPDGGTP